MWKRLALGAFAASLLIRGTSSAQAPASNVTRPGATPAPAESIRAAVERSLPLLQETGVAFIETSGCVSCHHNTLTAMTVATARSQDVRVDEELAYKQQELVARAAQHWREPAPQGSVPGDADALSYLLLTLSTDGYPPDEATDVIARRLSQQQASSGQWQTLGHRPPGEPAQLEATAVAIRALQVYAPKGERATYEAAIQRAAAWLMKAAPENTEGRAFQLLGLDWAHAGTDRIRQVARALISSQQPDGGWTQLPGIPSDAYATGQALFALVQTGALDVTDPVYKRGAEFLRLTQFDDGSWFVKSRATPLQMHVENGFPYGRDQFISAAATNWATMALALGVRLKR